MSKKKVRILITILIIILLINLIYTISKMVFKADEVQSIKVESKYTYNGNTFFGDSAAVEVTLCDRDCDPPPNPTISIPDNTFLKGWHMMTFPKTSESRFSNFKDMINFEPNNKIRWYNPATGGYESFLTASPDGLKPVAGRAYWVKVGDGESIGNIKFQINTQSNYEISVSRGWNLIGNPTENVYNIENLKIKTKNGNTYSYNDAVNNKLIYDYLWSYEKGFGANNGYHFISKNSRYLSYGPEGNLPVWRGAWFLVRSNDVSSIIF